ncbi:MAG TPA: methylmalonyl-CoA epimerase [Streptosporangiaceae bacterium]|nr:methylmalonyl-CoA epimerase [Streptosporangiaceae bacterium]
MFTRIDHVGIACKDLAAKVVFYESAFGLKVVSMETNQEQGVKEAMLAVTEGAPVPGVSYLQLLEPLGPETPVGKFLERRGEGVHHIGYGVDDISASISALQAAGIRLLDSRPRHGSMGAAIAFVHPKDVGGVLTELVQSPDRLHEGQGGQL